MVSGGSDAGVGGAPSPVVRPRLTSAARRAALADLVGGLLEARQDAAGSRFDAELDALERAGEVSAAAARLLRYWQRATVRAVVDHARLVLPPTLAALAEADEEALRAVADDSETWLRTLTEPGAAARGGSPAPTPLTGRGTETLGTERSPTSLEDHRRRLLIAGLTRDAGVQR